MYKKIILFPRLFFMLVIFFAFLYPIGAKATSYKAIEGDTKIPEEVVQVYTDLRNFRKSSELQELYVDDRLMRVAHDYGKQLLLLGDKKLDLSEATLTQRIRTAGYTFKNAKIIIIGSEQRHAMASNIWNREKYKKILTDKAYRDLGIARIDTGDVPDLNMPRYVWILILATPDLKGKEDWKKETIDFINAIRQENKLTPLKPNDRLDNMAQFHSDDMAIRDYVSHHSIEKIDVAGRAKEAGYHYAVLLENIGVGKSSGREIVEKWLESDDNPYRKNLLDAEIEDIGVGYRYLPGDAGDETHVHYWTIVFAKAFFKK